MDFDPDAYLASKEKPADGGFNPDAYLASKQPPTPSNSPTWWDKAKDYGSDIAKSAPGSLARASAGMMGILDPLKKPIVSDDVIKAIRSQDWSNPLLKGLSKDEMQRLIDHEDMAEKYNGKDYRKRDEEIPPLGTAALSGLKNIMGPTYHDPQTSPGKIADFAMQNVLFGAKNPKDLLNLPKTMRSLISGTSAGAAGELVPDDYPKIKMAAQMVGGFTPAAVEAALKSPDRATKNAAAMIKQAMAGKTDEQWKQADDLFQKSKQVGVPLTGPEAFPGGSQVQQLASDVAASPAAGSKIREFTGKRADQVEASVKDHLKRVGNDVGGQEAVNQMESAGTKVIQNAETERSNAVNKYYKAAANDKVPEEAMTSILKKVDAAIAADKTGIIAPKLQDFKNTLLEKSAPPASGSASMSDQVAETQAVPKPITDVENLDRARKYFRDKIELPAMSADAMPKEVSKAISPFLDEIRKEMEGTSSNYEQGKALYQSISENRVDPLMKGPVGKVAGKGADAQKEASYTRVMSELSSDVANPDRIRTLAKETSKIDKEAFPNVTRAYLEAKLNTSLKDLQGRRNPASGSNLRNAIEGTPRDKENLQTMIEETARIQGQDPKKTYAGFRTLLDVLDATGRVPGMGSQTQSRMENAAAARSNPVSGTIDSLSANPAKGISGWLRDMYYKNTYGKLAEVFTSPESVKEMKKLADLKPNSPEAQRLVSVMLTSATKSAEPHEDKKQDVDR